MYKIELWCLSILKNLCPICTRVVRFRTSQYQEVGIGILEKYTLSDLSTACPMYITKIAYALK